MSRRAKWNRRAISWLVCGLLIGARLSAASSLPFVATFSDYLKGNWKVVDGSGAWRSGLLSIEGQAEIVVSFDANHKGPSIPDSDYLKVWCEFDGGAEVVTLLDEVGAFAGREVRQTFTGGRRTMEVHIEALSGSPAVQILVDNIRVEAPGAGAGLRCPEPALASEPSLPEVDANSGVVRYPRLPGHVESGTFELAVNGVTIPVEELWGDPALVVDPTADNYALAVARLAYDPQVGGPAKIEIRSRAAIGKIAVSPQTPGGDGTAMSAAYHDLTVSGAVATVWLDAPRHLMVKIDDLEYLLLLIDRPEVQAPRPTDEEVLDLSDFLPPDRDQHDEVTAPLQRAIDTAAAAGKTLLVPDGLYRCGQLVLPSRAQIYLSAGALIQAIPDWTPLLWPPQAGANDTNKDSAFIYVGTPGNANAAPGEDEVRDVHLFGRGVIDGNGWNMRQCNDSSLTTANVKLFRSARAHDLVVEDVWFRDSARWSFNLLRSRHVRFSNVKLTNCLIGFRGNWANDQHFKPDGGGSRLFHIPVVTNLDGYDIDASQDVVVEDGLVFTGDDAFTPKVTGYLDLVGSCEDIVMRRNLIWTEKAALKVGPEMQADIKGVVFEDNAIVRSDRFVSLLIDGRPWVAIAGVRVINNTVERLGGNAYERFFRFKLFHAGAIRDVLIDGLRAGSDAPQFSTSEGFDAGSAIGPAVIRNVWVKGQPLDTAALFGPEPLVRYSDIVVEIPGRRTPP